MKIALLVAALAAQATVPAQTPTAEAPAEPRQASEPFRPMPNAFSDREGCTPIVVQVAGEDREYRGARLDQQPPAQLLYAVDRRVDGCREVTFVNDRRVGPEPSGR
jgi:hypothetical protein